MSEPTTGHDPERPAGQQPVPATGQPTEPIGATNPTEPIESTGPHTTAKPDHSPDTQHTPTDDIPEADWPETAGASPYEPHEAAALPDEPRGVPLGTLVFGLVVVALGLLILVSVFYDITLSGSAVAISLFLGAGLVLVIGGLVAARRSSGATSTGP